MEKMKSYKQFISEAKQVGVIYHYTDYDNAKKILDQNSLGTLSPSISVTRDRNFHKKSEINYRRSVEPHRNLVPTSVSFELNGDKLSDNHKITPFAHPQFNKNSNNDEAEEIVKPNIKNIKSFITKIRLHHKPSRSELAQLEKHGIPIEHNYHNFTNKTEYHPE